MDAESCPNDGTKMHNVNFTKNDVRNVRNVRILKIITILSANFYILAWHVGEWTLKEADAVFPILQSWRIQKRKHRMKENAALMCRKGDEAGRDVA